MTFCAVFTIRLTQEGLQQEDEIGYFRLSNSKAILNIDFRLGLVVATRRQEGVATGGRDTFS